MGYYFTGIGGIISLYAIWAFSGQVRFLFVAQRTIGVIIGFDTKLRYVGDNKRIYYHPIIEFETSAGQPTVFTYGGGSTRKRAEIGDKINVLYDPGKPDKPRVNSFMGMWAGPLAAAVLGGGTLAGGIDILMNR